MYHSRRAVCAYVRSQSMHTSINKSQASDGVAKERSKGTPDQTPQTRTQEKVRENLPSPTPPKSKPIGWSNWPGFHSSRCKRTCGSAGPHPSTKEISSSVPICHFVTVNGKGPRHGRSGEVGKERNGKTVSRHPNEGGSIPKEEKGVIGDSPVAEPGDQKEKKGVEGS